MTRTSGPPQQETQVNHGSGAAEPALRRVEDRRDASAGLSQLLASRREDAAARAAAGVAAAVNGEPAVLAIQDGHLIGVVAFAVRDGRAQHRFAVPGPGELTYASLALKPPAAVCGTIACPTRRTAPAQSPSSGHLVSSCPVMVATLTGAWLVMKSDTCGDLDDENREPVSEPVRVVVAENPGHAGDDRGDHDDAEVIFVWGGDGTVQRCIDAVAGTEAVLAILPAGTANLLATNLRIPAHLTEAMRTGLRGERRRRTPVR